jgi:acyl-coenzyme A thioesterase 9
MRTRVPFIEAFKKQQNETNESRLEATAKVERDLSPKTMSDSYTRIVSHVTRPLIER